ncbi:transposable element Tcb2 transposase [Trichonephila clavipes]|nr:transposable element Tcb2 transposase [Trichonephila clavipes]
MRRYRRVENRVWNDQEDHAERGSKALAASTCGPHSDSFNDTSRRRRSNCSTNNFQTPCRSKSSIEAPFPCTPFNTGTSATASTVVPSHCGMSQIGKSWCNGLGVIAYDSRSTLIVMRGTLTGQRYVNDIYRPHVGTYLNGFPGAIFQQDNAHPHTARVAQNFLRYFQTLPWLARSPDWSPVEHVRSAKTADAIVSLCT